MLSKRAVENAFIFVAILLLSANIAVKLVARTVIHRTQQYEKNGKRFYLICSLSPLWEVDMKEVLLEHDSWTRYHLDSAQQWAPLFPGGGVIHIGLERTPYTVSLMHQLRCLDVVRDQLNRPKRERAEEPTRHCMNYLRQMLFCRGDLQLDSYQYAHQVNAVHPHAIRRCKDWRAVYEKVGENQREYEAWLASGSTNSSLSPW
ncbi:hypothetical protein BV20DRAFT_943592 [Pilatotrama ljubarskyi]|nr:hypothetical protein BV20DRAFT_943592 [Pilatotrama ljubarskyi]